MDNSRLATLISSFSANEQRDIHKFLESPFFNSRKDVVKLFDWFCRNKQVKMNKEEAKQYIFGNDQVSDQELRLRMTYLSRLIEQYIAQKEFEADEEEGHLYLLKGMRRRNLGKHFSRRGAEMEKTLDIQRVRGFRFFEIQSRLFWEMHENGFAENTASSQYLFGANHAAEIAFLAQKLRRICLVMAHKSVWSANFFLSGEQETIHYCEKYYADSEPLIAIYLHCLKTFREPENETNFINFKKLLLSGTSWLPMDEMRSLLLWAINFCIRRINKSERWYFHEVLDLYKVGLAGGLLLENGILTSYTFTNAVAAGIQTGEYDWVEEFIETYKSKLEKRNKESSTNFNQARLEFARKRFDAVLVLLQRANYRDPLLNLAAKTLLLKTWFELGEIEALQSHLDAMRNFIHRKRVLGYHRTNFLNIIKYTDKLLTINFLDAQEVEKIQASIASEEPLTEREWLLSKTQFSPG